MAETNSLQVMGLLAVIAGVFMASSALGSSGGDDASLLIGGIISITGLYFILGQKKEAVNWQAPKTTVTTTNTREVRSDGEVIALKTQTETSSKSAGV